MVNDNSMNHYGDKHEFMAYLQFTLIPDLRESGQTELANDFETALYFMWKERRS